MPLLAAEPAGRSWQPACRHAVRRPGQGPGLEIRGRAEPAACLWPGQDRDMDNRTLPIAEYLQRGVGADCRLRDLTSQIKGIGDHLSIERQDDIAR